MCNRKLKRDRELETILYVMVGLGWLGGVLSMVLITIVLRWLGVIQ